MHYPTIESTLGNTPLVRLQRLNEGLAPDVTVLCKMEGNNPAGSVKDRPAFYMIQGAQSRGEIQPGDRLIEATSGNTGIALAMVGAILGYRMTLIMPDNLSDERKRAMTAYGAELILVSEKEGMEGARDLALEMEKEGQGRVLNQFANPDCPRAHYETTGPEIWKDTNGAVTHFVSAMGTTGTIMGVSQYLKEQNPDVTIVGLQPSDGSKIAGIRRWPIEYRPEIFDPSRVDVTLDIDQHEAEEMARQLAVKEGIFCGVSAGGAVSGALRVARELTSGVVVCIICDRGDRYLSTDLFPR
ncbi:MAG: cysteine synthase CysM [Gammaproteobacteria bacterium]|nr:cysteine synthase CysM [Gammaproteobacteria bacterium]NCW08860.1 cysteine synthase CysM [Gammaproteobacteria bacterium]NCW73450.1 cysteine synthase CysM [Gammaproteobacteria bacterium]NCX48028.1 cysteine synthase CysM [Gammaproteobacteria bacterium]